MSVDTLERKVLEVAISARRALNENIPIDQENACYDLLVASARYSRIIESGDARFIGRMLETYEEIRRKRAHLYQERLFGPSKGSL
jgi:hypothetical protein